MNLFSTPTTPFAAVTATKPWSRPRGVATAGSTSDSVADAVAQELPLLPTELIGGDESIIFAIKPSLWYIAFDSARWVIGALVAITCAGFISEVSHSVSESQVMSLSLAAAGVRIAIAFLRWVSRFYVLTNRRVMKIRGVFKADLFECSLLNIRNSGVTRDFLESFTKLGTLQFILTGDGSRQHNGNHADGNHHKVESRGGGELQGHWRNIRNPDEVHAEIRKAIERAIDSQPHL